LARQTNVCRDLSDPFIKRALSRFIPESGNKNPISLPPPLTQTFIEANSQAFIIFKTFINTILFVPQVKKLKRCRKTWSKIIGFQQMSTFSLSVFYSLLELCDC